LKSEEEELESLSSGIWGEAQYGMASLRCSHSTCV
jgi:hypothetical protein